jgi:hypothetical protein
VPKKPTEKRQILANPDEPRAGDYSYGLYDKAHPVYGDPSTINHLKGQLRGLRGKTVTATFSGARIDDDGTKRRFTAKRTFVLNRYTDMFGPGSAYSSAIHDVRDRHSDETLVTYSITIEVAA